MSEKPTLAESMVVQRVALIFANHAHNFQYHAGGNPPTDAGFSWGEFSAREKMLALAAAKAAIASMRKPSKKMLDAAAKAMSPGKRPTPTRVSNAAKHEIRYRAMIDAALGEHDVESWWEGQRLNNEPVENVAESTT